MIQDLSHLFRLSRAVWRAPSLFGRLPMIWLISGPVFPLAFLHFENLDHSDLLGEGTRPLFSTGSLSPVLDSQIHGPSLEAIAAEHALHYGQSDHNYLAESHRRDLMKVLD